MTSWRRYCPARLVHPAGRSDQAAHAVPAQPTGQQGHSDPAEGPQPRLQLAHVMEQGGGQHPSGHGGPVRVPEGGRRPVGHGDGVAPVRSRQPVPQLRLTRVEPAPGPGFAGRARAAWPQRAGEAPGQMTDRAELGEGCHGLHASGRGEPAGWAR